MENMRIQQQMGAISRRTIMELSPYTTDSAQELRRLEEEGIYIFKNQPHFENNNTETTEEDNTQNE